jgi:hypothetical protein
MSVQHQNRSQANILIENRQSANRILWSGPDWQWLRIIFLSSPENRGGCVWCGNIAKVVCHPGTSDVYRYRDRYLDFRRSGCYPMCLSCNAAERAGKVLCPRCSQQGHYIPAGVDGKGDGQVCWSCKPAEERERLIYGKEQRQRQRNEITQKKNRKYRTVKVINKQTGKWVTLSRK